MDEKNEAKLLDIRETAKRYGFSETTLRRYASQQKIPTLKIGRAVRIDP